MELFEFEFIRRAFLIGIMLAVILPCIGIVVVFKRLSLVGDALSHTTLVGVALGLMFGINPIWGGILICVLSALAIEIMQKRISRFKENALVIVMSLGVGLAGILSSKVKSGVAFSSYLFGSIVSISDSELYLIILIVIGVLSTFFYYYHALFYIILDENGARRSGVKVNRINFIFTVLTAITIAIASKTIGVLIVSSLLVIPILCAMQVSNGFKSTLVYGIIFSVAFMLCGLYISYYLDLRPGGSIALISVISFVMLLIFKKR